MYRMMRLGIYHGTEGSFVTESGHSRCGLHEDQFAAGHEDECLQSELPILKPRTV